VFSLFAFYLSHAAAVTWLVEDQRAVPKDYTLDTIFFHMDLFDDLGANVNISLKDATGTILPTSIIIIQDRIEELDSSDQVVVSYNTSQIQWSYADGSSAAGDVTFVTISGTIPNGATVTWTYKVNQVVLPVTFAGFSFNLSAGSFKYSIEILNWPFKNLTNFLQVLSNGTVVGVPLANLNFSVDNDGNVQAIEISGAYPGGPPYILSFLRYYLSDGNITLAHARIRVQEINPLVVQFIFKYAHANSAIVYDPDLSALVTTGDGGGGGGNGILAVEIAVPIAVGVCLVVIVLVILAGAGFCYWRHHVAVHKVQRKLAMS